MSFLKHLGVILDGNRRFSKSKGITYYSGLEKGLENVLKLLEWCRENEVKELTLYAFSMQNFKRDTEEKKQLFDVFLKAIEKFEKEQRKEKHLIRIKFIGRTHLFPKKISEKMTQLEDKTSKNKDYKLNIAMGYGGREEIEDALQKIISKNLEPTLKNIQENLYLKSEPQLIIRTGGAMRTSNFLPWQSTYSEWIFLKKYWPEVTKKDLDKALQEFKQRERRFGK